MKTVLHQVQGIFVGHFFAEQLVYQGIKRADKEEMMLTLLGDLLEGVFQRTLQKRHRHGRRQMKHLAASGNLAIVTVIREFTVY